ncbi:hypothetical protein NSS71_08365 [Niallia sp. FSL W8-0951]|uniref:hypothetical protein n=1 Tax=Niallia sp. FSL W8-0951 TaxID=2954639 RepID=UPI0030F8ADBF
MLADINNINYIKNINKFHIVVEYSRLPIETFDTEDEAQDFIRGYLSGLELTESMRLGKYFRLCVEFDIKDGVKYYRVSEFMETIYKNS